MKLRDESVTNILHRFIFLNCYPGIVWPPTIDRSFTVLTSHSTIMSQHMNAAVDEDAALLQFPKEFENAETLLISEVNIECSVSSFCTRLMLPISVAGQHVVEVSQEPERKR